MDWSYSWKVGIVFAVYQKMRLKGVSWAGPYLNLNRKNLYIKEKT